LSPVRATRKLLVPACTSAVLPALANAVPLTLLTVTVPPAEAPLTVGSAGTFEPPPPPPGAPGLPLLPHPSMRDATVTNEIACAQNSRREVFGLSMAAEHCKQCARLRALSGPPRREVISSDLR
jgi:hypothetical protein